MAAKRYGYFRSGEVFCRERRQYIPVGLAAASMVDRTLQQGRHIPALEVTEGAGVTVYRSIGTPAMRNYDPFMLLDQISSENPDDYIACFPAHPHRGFNTFSYMIEGDMEHRDSMGNKTIIKEGDIQVMSAGTGVQHSEYNKNNDKSLQMQLLQL